ncbi:MAG TPA: hypothetical protein VNE58_02710 [Casimicrobiaceae bacterium]|nr:hypothetical protein [Casimicrobiaceae bacterium]
MRPRRAGAARTLGALAFVAITALGTIGAALANPFPPLWGSSAVHYPPVAWPVEPADPTQCGANCGQWLPYTRFQSGIADPRTQDPSNGGTAPQNYVNIASSCVDKTFPSTYYALRQGAAPDGSQDVIMFRWRVEQIANNYATGPSAGPYGASDPWSSALWSVLFDVNGDGFIDLAAHLDGSSGTPSMSIDRLLGLWSRLPTQSLDYVGDPTNVRQLGHNPTAFVDPVTSRILNFQGSVTPSPIWPNGAVETQWDYGTTRSKLVTSSPCNEYFIDYQIPVAMLDASSQGGPKITRATPISMLFCTANSLNDPFQKDCALNRTWTGASGKPAPFGDYVSFNQSAPYSQPIVSSVTASPPTSCPGSYALSAIVQDTLAVVNGVVVPSVKSVRFFYYYDANGNGAADDGGAWTLAAAATRKPGTLNTWTASWNATGLSKGQFLIGVQAVDDNAMVDDGVAPSGVDNRTFSYVAGDAQNRIHVGGVTYVALPSHSPGQTPTSGENWWGNPSVTGTQTALVGVANNACGFAPAFAKTASAANVAPSADVDFTLTLTNPTTSAITLSRITDALPAGFTFAATTGGSLTPSSSPSGGATGTVSWSFSPAVVIAASGSGTLQFRTTAPTVAGSYNNTATATTSFGSIASAPVAVAVDSARLSFTKTPSTYNVSPDGTTQLVYTLVYANASTVPIAAAQISDTLPAGVTYGSCAGGTGCSNASGTVSWTLGTLAAGASGSAMLTVTVDPGYAGASLTNNATVSGTDPGGNPVMRTATSTIAINQPQPVAPAFTLAKSASATQIAPGASVTWTLAYRNFGTAGATGVTISDALPAGFTFVSCAGAPCAQSAGTVTFNVGAVAAGSTGTVTVTASAANPFTTPSPAVNSASINWTQNTGPPVTATAQVGITGQSCSNYYFRAATTNVGAGPDGGVRSIANTTAPTSATASTISFNATTTPAEAARFYQDPPANGTLAFSGNITTSFYVSKVNGPQLRMDVFVYDYDPVSGGKTLLGSQSFAQTGGGTNVLFTFALPLSGTLPINHRILWIFAAYSNNNTTFTFNYDGAGSPSRASFCATPPASLAITKTADVPSAPAGSGTPIQYTISFANNGGVKSTATQIVDTLPANVTFVSATLNGASVTPSQSGQQLTFANVRSSTDAVAGEVSAGASGTLVINATIGAAATGTLTNTASISSSETTPVASTATTTMTGGGGGGGTPALAVSLIADRATAQPGDTVTYTVTVVNIGTANAASVQVGDVLPLFSYYTFGACSGGCTNTSGTLGWNVGTLAPGASATYTFTMIAGGAGLPAGVTVVSNAASASATSVPPVASGTVNVALNGNPRLTITKAATPLSGLSPGSTISWSITVTNAGNVAAQSVVVTDAIPSRTVFAGSLAASTGNGTFDAVNNRVVFNVGTLAAGASATLGFDTTVGSLAPGSTTLVNTATATAGNAAAAVATNSASASAAPVLVLQKQGPTRIAYPAATLTQAANGTTVAVNDSTQLSIGDYVAIGASVVQVVSVLGNAIVVSAPVVALAGTPVIGGIVYSLAVSNTGNAVAANVTLTDTLPAGATFIVASDGGTFAAGTVTWSLADIDPSESRTVSVTIIPGGPGALLNSAAATCSACGAPVNAAANSFAGGLRVTKRTTTPIRAAGGTATYIIDVLNTSASTISGVTVNDTLPTGFSYASTTSVVNDGVAVPLSVVPVPGATVLEWGTLSIAANKVVTVTFVANIAATVGAATYHNPAGATPASSTVDYDPLTSTADDVTVLAAGTGLVQGRVFRDNDNDGAYDAALDTPLSGVGLTITDAASTVHTLATDANGWFSRVLAPGITTIDVANADIPAGLALRAGSNDPSSVVVPAGGAGTVDTVYVMSGTAPDLAVAKTHTGNFVQGQTGTYMITVNNVGAGPSVGQLSVVDTLPPGLAATAMSGSGWTCNVSTTTCTRSDPLPAGTSYPPITLIVNVAPNASSSVTNTATVSGGGDGTAANNVAHDPTTITSVTVPSADLTIAKTHVGNFAQGQIGASYTIAVTNVGSGSTAGAVTVTDVLPAGLTATAINGLGWSCALSTLRCTRSDALAAGAAYPLITLTVDVSPGATLALTNQVSVAGGGDTNTSNNTANDATVITAAPQPDLVIAKALVGTLTRGQIGAVYSIVVTNQGAAATSASVTVVDVLPAGLTATAIAGSGWSCVLATLSCTRSDALGPGASHPAITLTVDVGTSAPALITNIGRVSGGGDAVLTNNEAADAAQVQAAGPGLSPEAIPTLAEWALLLLITIVGFCGSAASVRRQRF